jgi:hypothetical protein
MHGPVLTTLVAVRVEWNDGDRRRVLHRISGGEDPLVELRVALQTIVPTASRAMLERAVRRVRRLPAGVPAVIRSAFGARRVGLAVDGLIVPVSVRQVWELADLDDGTQHQWTRDAQRYEYLERLAYEWCLANGRGALVVAALTDPDTPVSKRVPRTAVVHPRCGRRHSRARGETRCTTPRPAAPAIGIRRTPGLVALPDEVEVSAGVPVLRRPVPAGASDWLSSVERRGLHLPGV